MTTPGGLLTEEGCAKVWLYVWIGLYIYFVAVDVGSVSLWIRLLAWFVGWFPGSLK
jgi:hypothetical protein